MPREPNPTAEPVRAIMHITLVDATGHAADRVLALGEALARFGMELETCSVEVMDRRDVIPGSMLDRLLHAA